MGTRERWVDDVEVESKGPLAAAVLKSIRTTPGAIVSGKILTLSKPLKVLHSY